jgi:hypothetical protein
MSRTLEAAKEIVDAGIKFGAWKWDDPDTSVDEVKIQEAAEKLVDASTQLSQNGSINEAVLEILRVAQVEPGSDATRQAYVARFGGAAPVASNGNGTPAPPEAQPQPAAPAASAFGGQPAAAPPESVQEAAEAADQSGNVIDISKIFPGYDDLKVADIKKAILESAAGGDLSPEEWEIIKGYEAAHEERKTILKLEPEFKAPEPEPSPVAFTATGAGAPPSSNDDVPLDQVYTDGPRRASQEGMAFPQDANPNVAPLPIDLTALTDQQITEYGTRYHSLFARAQWLISQEEGRAAVAEHLEREAERDAFVQSYELHKSSIPEEKRSQPTALEAARKQAEKDAESAESVRTWRSRKVRHNVEVRELKALSNGYDKTVWRVDKELDRRMRQQTTGRAA